LHKHNLNFKIKPCERRDETSMYKEYDVQKRYKGLGMEFSDVRDFRCESHITECMTRLAIKDKHKDMIIAQN
jgi:hypothetical protein